MSTRPKLLFSLKIRGKMWKVYMGGTKDSTWGLTSFKNRSIYLHPSLWKRKQPILLLQVVAHELMHAIFPDLNEESIVEYDTLLGRMIRRLNDVEWRDE